MNTAIRPFEYRNDFFYIVIDETSDASPKSYIYRCGINISRFDPLCWGKAGICSNPAFKGLQLLRADVSAFAAKRGLITKSAQYLPSGTVFPAGDGWYRENPLQIENASSEDIRHILEFSVTDLVQTVLAVCFPGIKVPPGLMDPLLMQRFLESLSVPNYKQAAPPPVAKVSV